MQREIKFRAWDGKRIRYDVAIFRGDIYQVYEDVPDTNDISLSLSENWICTQSTGLKDKNGVEIYEGDIIYYRDISGSGRSREFGPRMVKWFKDSCNFNVTRPDSESEIEVIGNIYENTELCPQ